MALIEAEKERVQPALDQAAADIDVVLRAHFRKLVAALDLGRPLTPAERVTVSSWLVEAINAAVRGSAA